VRSSPEALVRQLDTLCARAWAPLEQEEDDGWVLRAAGGISLRANSVWPRAALGGRSLDGRIDAAEKFYRERGLRPCFQLSPASEPPELPLALDRRGYRAHTATDVMISSTGARPPRGHVELLATADVDWSGVMLGAADDPEDSRGRLDIIERLTLPRVHALLRQDGVPAAIGLGVADGDWVGLYAMRTLPSRRRQGLARQVVAALLGWGASRGARRAYLQVEHDNEPALALYRSFGFRREYGYRYATFG
jgi:GNAT superfamily N-acetyltransferase